MKILNGPRRLARRLTYANVVATLALVIALGGGTAYAASHLIKGSQIAKHTISASNIKKKTLTSALFKKGTLKRGRAGATGPAGPAGAAGPAGSAAAYGVIETNGNGNPVFEPALSSGFTSVTTPSPGVLCIAVPAGAPAAPLMISDAGNEAGHWEQVSAQQCGGTADYELANESGATALTGQLAIALP